MDWDGNKLMLFVSESHSFLIEGRRKNESPFFSVGSPSQRHPSLCNELTHEMGAFLPSDDSTPVCTSTPAGRTYWMASRTLSGLRPPARITGLCGDGYQSPAYIPVMRLSCSAACSCFGVIGVCNKCINIRAET